MTTDVYVTAAWCGAMLLLLGAIIAFAESRTWARISYALRWRQRDRLAKEARLRQREANREDLGHHGRERVVVFPFVDWTKAAA